MKKAIASAISARTAIIYFELFLGAIEEGAVMAPIGWRLAPPEDRLHRQRQRGADVIRRPGIHRRRRQKCCKTRRRENNHREEGGAPDWQTFEHWRDAASERRPMWR